MAQNPQKRSWLQKAAFSRGFFHLKLLLEVSYLSEFFKLSLVGLWLGEEDEWPNLYSCLESIVGFFGISITTKQKCYYQCYILYYKMIINKMDNLFLIWMYEVVSYQAWPNREGLSGNETYLFHLSVKRGLWPGLFASGFPNLLGGM